MIEAGQFALLRPWWLLAIPATTLLAWFMARRWVALGGWDRIIEAPLRPVLEKLGHIARGQSTRQWTGAALASAIALALSGPALYTTDRSAFRNLDGLVIAVDLSRSMTDGGNLPRALTASRMLLAGAGARPAALIVYGEDAYVASAFTIDPRSLGNTIAVLDNETVPGAGSRPERALELAKKLLAESGVLTGDVIVVSDGGGFGAARTAADELRKTGSRVSGLFVSPTEAAPAEMPRPQRQTIEDAIRSGGGIIADAIDPSPVISLASTPLSERLASAGYGVLAWTDYGRWLLVIALFPALLLFRRRT
jgi:Ca-activated chloride channel family protein